MPDVVLPALDEIAAVEDVLARMPSDYHPIVVDNGSTDGTGALARRLGAQVVDEPHRGFGAACWSGLLAAQADVVCFMDCDGSLDAGDLPLVVGPVVAGTSDLVIGERRAARGSWPLHARMANRAVVRSLRRRTGVRLRDLGPMRAASRTGLLDLGIADRRSGWPLEMVVRAAAAGWRVTGTPVPYGPRSGRSKVTGTAAGTATAVRDMASVLRRGTA